MDLSLILLSGWVLVKSDSCCWGSFSISVLLGAIFILHVYFGVSLWCFLFFIF